MPPIRILSLKKLIAATSNFGGSTHVIEQQVVRTQARLNQGVDVNGNTFAPYKDQKKEHPNRRPLERAARLFESPHYDMTRNQNGVEFHAVITGQAAKIARYQNFRRRFLGYSRIDRAEAREEVKSMIAEAFRNHVVE